MKNLVLSLFLALILLKAGVPFLKTQQENLIGDETTSIQGWSIKFDYGIPESPVKLDVHFLNQPILGEPVTLIVRVSSSISAPQTQVSVELPEGIQSIDSIETVYIDLAAGETRQFEYTVSIQAIGELELSAAARYDAGNSNIFGDRVTLYITSSESGVNINSLSPEARAWDPDAPVIITNRLPDDQRPKDQPAQPNIKHPELETNLDINQVDGMVTIYGYFYYTDNNAQIHPLNSMRVEIWDDDDLSPDDHIATLYTDSNGRYETTVSNGDESGGLDIFVKAFATDDHAVQVTEHNDVNDIYEPGGDIYRVQTPTENNISDGTHYVGTYAVGDTVTSKAWFIYDTLGNLAWNYLYSNVNWDNNHNLEVRWTPVITDDAFYRRSEDFIHLGDRYAWQEDVILHEFGHFVMGKFYPGDDPPRPNCSKHDFGVPSSEGCAWSEGWATFLAQAMQGDSIFRYGSSSFNLETPSPFPVSDEDEASVAASLWDVFDSANDSQDTISRGIGAWNDGIWEVFSFEHSNTAREFFDDWNGRTEGDACEVSKIFRFHRIFVTKMCAPTTPGNVQASDGTNRDAVVVKWYEGGMDKDFFEVYRATSASGDKIYLADVNFDIYPYVYTDTAVITLKTYWYFIRGCNDYGCSPYSTPNDGWRSLNTPGGVSASDGTHTGFVRITWDAIAEAASYRVYRAQTENGTKLFTGYTTDLTWDTDLTTPGVLYYFWVQPCSASLNCEGYSDYDTGWEPLSAPGSLTASDGTSSAGVDLDWTGVEGAQTYDVYRSTSSGSLGSVIASTFVSEYEDNTAVVTQQYYYQVKACGDPGLVCSLTSNQDGGWRALAAPANVLATDGAYTDKVRVSWSSVSGATSYKIYRGYGPSDNNSQVGTTSSLYFDDTPVAPGVTLYYWVKACTVSSCSPYSTSDTGGIAPSMNGYSVVASDGGYENLVRITWGIPTGTTSSNIYRAETSDGPKSFLGSVSTGVYSDTTAIYGTNYYYWIKPCSESYGCGDFSSYNIGWVDPGPPGNVQASDGIYSDRVAITWDAVHWATSYEVYETSSEGGAKTLVGTSATNSLNDLIVTYQNTYYYWVKACNASGCSGYSDYDTGYAKIPAPQNVRSDGNTNRVDIFWDSVSDATHYEIYRATSEGGAKTLLGTETGVLYNDSTPIPGVTYYFWVKACSTVLAVCSDFSDYDIGGASPLIPGNVQATDGTKRSNVTITWDAVTSTHYIVYRDAQMLGTIPLEHWYDSSAEPFRYYDYQVQACNQDLDLGCSALSTSNEGWRTIDWVSNIAATDGTYTTTVRVTWDAVNGANLYQVYRGSHISSNEYIGQTSNLWYEDDAAAPGDGNYYFVKACSSFGCGDLNTSDYGYRAVAIPQNVSATDGAYTDKVLVSWDDLPIAESYTVIRRASNNPEGPAYSGCAAAAGETSCEVDIYYTDLGKLFYFWVQAKADVQYSDYSNFDTGGTPPLVPTNLEVSERYGEIAISWWGKDHATHYQIWRAESAAGAKTLIASPTSAVWPYADTSAVPTQGYFYWIKSCNSFSCSAFSSSIQATRPLEIPDSVDATNLTHANKILVTWNYSGPAEFIEVHRALEYEDIYELAGTSTANAYTDTEATPGWSYYYKVKSCTSAGCSEFSFPANGRRAMPPPENVQASDGSFSDKVKLTWLTIPGATYYEVYCDDGPGGVENQLCMTTSAISFDDQPVPLQTYYYAVKACQPFPVGCSELSTVNDGWRAMPNPSFMASTSGYADRVVLTWETLPEAQNYKVWRADTPTGTKIELSYQSAVGYTDLTVSPGEMYYYWLQACNTYGCSDYGTMQIGGTHIYQVFLPLVIRTVDEGNYTP